jgi:cobalt/nickel transport system permease protein
MVLALQSLLFGAGGITALAINALAMGLAGAAVAVAAFRSLRGLSESAAVVVAAWLSVLVSAALVALVLGLQPLIAQREDGQPLFFPFGIAVTLPAVLLPHLLIGAVEGLLTLMVWRYAKARKWTPA